MDDGDKLIIDLVILSQYFYKYYNMTAEFVIVDEYKKIMLMKNFVLVVEITIRMINIAHHYIKIIPISAFKLHSSSSCLLYTSRCV